MYAYIHTFAPTRETYNLSPLQPTEPIHVRLFFSPLHISKENYRQYLSWRKSEDQLTEFHAFGKVPISTTLTKVSLMPPGAFATQVGYITYDFMLEAQDDYLAYLEFVRQTLLVESQRPLPPAFKLKCMAQVPELQEPVVQDPYLSMRLESDSTLVSSRDDAITNPSLPTFLLIYPNHCENHPIYTTWLNAIDAYKSRAQFLRQKDATVAEPMIMYSLGHRCWMQCDAPKSIEEHMNKWKLVLYELSTGHLVEEKSGEPFWETLLGTEAMPHVTITASLGLQGAVLKNGSSMLDLTEAQLAVIKPFFTNKDIRPFSLKALYELFATPQTSKTTQVPAVRPGTICGTLTGLSGLSDLAGLDTYACDWETVNATPETTPDATTMREQIGTLLRDFATSTPLDMDTTSIPVSPTLFQYGFFLFLLRKQQVERQTSSNMDYKPLLQYYKQSKMDLQDVPFTNSHLPILYPLLAPNTAILGSDSGMLEARILLSIYQYPVEYANVDQQLSLFHIVVKEFAKTLKRSEEGRVGAKVLWDAFLAFLRKHRLDYVGFFGSQQEFNDVLRDLGWEQKRVAAGKVWLKMAI